MDKLQIATLLNEAGTRQSDMDTHLGRATERLGVLMVRLQQHGLSDMLQVAQDAQESISVAHDLLALAGAYTGSAARAVEQLPVDAQPKIEVPTAPVSQDPPQIDARTLSDDDMQYYVRHPETWSKVAASAYLNQRIQEFQAQSGGKKYDPSWDESKYRGVLK